MRGTKTLSTPQILLRTATRQTSQHILPGHDSIHKVKEQNTYRCEYGKVREHNSSKAYAIKVKGGGLPY